MRNIILALCFIVLAHPQTTEEKFDIIEHIKSLKNATIAGNTLERLYKKRAINNAENLYQNSVNSILYIATKHGKAAGSIIDKEGHVVTNYHILEGAEKSKIQCVFYSESFQQSVKNISSEHALNLELIAFDKSKDLALLKVERSMIGKMFDSLKPIKMGEDSSIKIAQDVFSIGHPTIEGDPVLWGYARGSINGHKIHSWKAGENGFKVKAKTIFTQTDAFKGSSGSPLMNKDGEMVGIVTAVHRDGMNIAVSIDEVKKFINSELK